jgi:tetratricopeptide (TPR) repeat protein
LWLGHGFANIRPVEVYRLAQAAAKRLLELDPNSADAHLLLGHLAWEVDWDPEAAEPKLRRAIELGPSSAEAHHILAWFLVQQGLFQEAKEKFATAYVLDPLSFRTSRDLAAPFRHAGEFDQAIAQYRRTLRSHPDDWLAYLQLGRTYFTQGKSKNAVVALEKAVALNPGSARARAYLGYAFAKAGNQGHARALLAELIAEAESGYVWPLALALLYAGLGEDDKALEWLETAFEDRVSQLVWLDLNYPEFDSLREYPRYKTIIERINPVN